MVSTDRRICSISTIWLFCMASSSALAQSFQMDMLETDDLRLLYLDPIQTHMVPHVVRSFHNSLNFQRDVFGWQPYDKTTVLLKDFRDYGNAAARGTPNNAVLIDIAPLSRTFETNTANERITLYMDHELVHVVTMDMWNSQDAYWRRLLRGKPMPRSKHPESILYFYLATPRVVAPGWYFEGSAVFFETWLAGGIGRAQGAYDEMVFRAMVRDDAHFYSPLGLVSEGVTVDFQIGANTYLYGTRFMSYLGLTYSPQKVLEWVQRTEGSKRYYVTQFEHVFGKPLNTVWREWVEWEHEFQRQNLAAVREFPITLSRNITQHSLGSVSRSFVDTKNGRLIGAFRYPGVVAHVGAVSLTDGSLERFADVKGPMLYRVTSVAYDPDSETVFYAEDNNAFRDLMSVDLNTGKKRKLLKDARIGDLVFSPVDRAIWGLRHLNGYVSLVRIPYPYDSWNMIHTWSYGEVPYDIDVSPDGTLLSASVGQINGDQSLQIFKLEDLQTDKAEPISQFDFGTAVPEGFVFSPDGKYLFGSSYYTGISNIFRYELATGDIEAVTNTETGFFRPIPMEDGSLIVFDYTGQGFVPTVIDPVPLEDVSAIHFLGTEVVKKHPVVKEWQLGSATDISLESITRSTGKYKPLSEMGPQSAYPILEGYKDSTALGYNFRVADPLEFSTLDISTSYSPDNDLPSKERTHLSLDYKALNWYATYRHNGADFYDLAGPTKRSRKGDAYIIGYERALIYDPPRQLDFSAQAAYYTGIDTLPGNQNVPSSIIDEIFSADIGLHYTNTRESIGAVDHEKGYRWDINLTVDDSDFATVVKPHVGLDFGFALPWKHSSIWFYNAAGSSDGSVLDPLGSFYFGGFGNNYVDDREEKRYREYNSFPGFEIDEISGTDFVKSTFEWNLPPVRFRQVGTPSFFLKNIRPAMFFGGLRTDLGKTTERTVTTLGAQLDLEFTIVHRLPMTFSVGYAAGYEHGDRLSDEWMISLKIL